MTILILFTLFRSPLEHSGLVTASIVGGTFGGLVGGTVADLFGRKFVLVITGMALLPTALTAASANTLGAVVFSRACAAAVAMATASASIPYVFELAPKRRRGMMPAIWGLAATSAWACVRTAAVYAPHHQMSKHGWRVVGGGPHLVLALAQLLSLCRLPESPRWLASQNKMHLVSDNNHCIFLLPCVDILWRSLRPCPSPDSPLWIDPGEGSHSSHSWVSNFIRPRLCNSHRTRFSPAFQVHHDAGRC